MTVTATKHIAPDKDSWLRLRARSITSTEISSLFDCSPYESHFELWHRKKLGILGDFASGDRIRWGKRLQNAIGFGAAEDFGWEIRAAEEFEYWELEAERIGASFDFEIISPKSATLEVKNVDALIFREGWLVDEDDDVEAPPHIEIQLQQQCLVKNHDEGYIAALVGGNRLVPICRERNEKVCEGIRQKVAEFWESIELNRPPEPQFPGDAAAVCKLYANAMPGKFLDASMDRSLTELARQYAEAAQQKKWATELQETLKAQILMRIGDHERAALGDGFKISAGTVSCDAAVIERKAYSYRNFRLTAPKVK